MRPSQFRPCWRPCLSSNTRADARVGGARPFISRFAGIIYASALTPATPSRQCVAEVLEEAYCLDGDDEFVWHCNDGGANAAAFHFISGYGFAGYIDISIFLDRTLVDPAEWRPYAHEALRSRCGPLALQEIEQTGLTTGDLGELLWPEPDDEQ